MAIFTGNTSTANIKDGSTSDLPGSGAPIDAVPKTMFGCSDRVAVQNFDSVAWQPIGQICLEVPVVASIRLAVSNASALMFGSMPLSLL